MTTHGGGLDREGGEGGNPPVGGGKAVEAVATAHPLSTTATTARRGIQLPRSLATTNLSPAPVRGFSCGPQRYKDHVKIKTVKKGEVD
jgi:hypothetical protein